MELQRVVNRVPTPFLINGPSFADADDVKIAILVIPGNPGTIEYYREFMGLLHSKLEEQFGDKTKIPVWGISHAGHQVNGVKLPFPSLSDNRELYGLAGQAQHKLEFIKNYIPSQIRLITIGHSIGCQITLQVLKQLEDAQTRIIKSYMLFPTIERMAITPNGKFCTRLLPVKFVLDAVVWSISWLPTSVHQAMIGFYFKMGCREPHESIYKAAAELFNKSVYDRFTAMAQDEFSTVVDLDEECLKKHMDRLYFYFGTIDNWCPMEYVQDMQQRFPDLQHQVCDQRIEHAFVIESSAKMADILFDKIAADITKHVK